jgi:Putative transposase
VQRFGSSGANLHPHLHALFADGVFVEQEGVVRFYPLSEPTMGELNAIAWTVCERTLARLRERGLWLDAEPGNDPLANDQPMLAALAGASLSGTLLFGEAGERPMRVFASVSSGKSCSTGERKSNNGFGFDLDATVRVPEGNRERLERLARYMGRPSIAEDRVEQREDGRYCLRFKRPWSNGTAAVVVSGIELVARLAALVPPPRMHLVRYFGVFAPRARLREEVVPVKTTTPQVADCPPGCPHSGERFGASSASHPSFSQEDAKSRRRRMTWAQLLKRVFAIDVSICPRCGQQGMQQIGIITQPEVIRRMVESMERAQGP